MSVRYKYKYCPICKSEILEETTMSSDGYMYCSQCRKAVKIPDYNFIRQGEA